MVTRFLLIKSSPTEPKHLTLLTVRQVTPQTRLELSGSIFRRVQVGNLNPPGDSYLCSYAKYVEKKCFRRKPPVMP
uniref:Uncharacterized protein n=1 Tax=Kuenenia stuttgartiensis TaxID=174633 RepID=Q1PUS6_KUEST|nr:unknown protein [Candidatus Kuenenia stuttgartiensis]